MHKEFGGRSFGSEWVPFLVHCGLVLLTGALLFAGVLDGAAEKAVGVFFMLFLMSLKVAFHEFGHAIIAYRAGDYTVRSSGYLTLNMLRYTDPFSSILLPGLIFIWAGVFIPGGAVYLNPALIDQNRKLWVDLGGIIMDILTLIALIFIAYATFPFADPAYVALVSAAVYLSIGLIIFNLLPIPPLDGYSALAELAPARIREIMYVIRAQAGFMILLAVFMFGRGLFGALWDGVHVIYSLLWLDYLPAYMGLQMIRVF